MDQEIARTLEELEQKIVELERALRGMGERREAPRASAPVTIPARPDPSEPLGGPSRPSRIVDEKIEPSQSGGAAESPPAFSESVSPQSPPAYSAATPQGTPQPPAATPQGDPPSPPASAAPNAPPMPGTTYAPLPPRAPSPTPPAPRPSPTPPAEPATDSRPDPEQLLRFRDRLERTARELTHEYDELLGRLSYPAVSAPAGPTISFARGAPSLDIVDVEGLRAAAVRAFESDPAGTTAYGTSVGYPRLRSWIADLHGVPPERVLVTNGSMQADAFLFEHLIRPGDDVIVERPSYDRTLLSLRQRGARLHAVELEPDGIDTDGLARLLEAGVARPTLAHIIPNFQNPAGYTLSAAKRRALLELAAQHRFVVFEDDPYVALRFEGEMLPTMLSMAPERVVYASSFSKTVCPGIRVGYLVGPPELIEGIAQLATNTYISPSMVSQSIVYEFCASGAIDDSIATVKAALAQRARTLADALRRDLPDAEFVEPQGGYFMWVTLPPGTDVQALFAAAAARGVSFVKGTDFLLEGGENTLRLAYSGVTPEQIDVGIERLAEAYRSL